MTIHVPILAQTWLVSSGGFQVRSGHRLEGALEGGVGSQSVVSQSSWIQFDERDLNH